MGKSEKEDLDLIRSYYDHNTPRFLSYGEQRKTRTIHRPVWGEGVQNEGQALHYIHNLILRELYASQKGISRHLSALDMGCGVGASLFFLANQLGEDFTGVGLTISPVQVRIARAEKRFKDLNNRCMFVVGDFLKPPIQKQFDLVYAIEAFAHSTNPEAFFQTAASLLKPGGRLVLSDDFLSGKGDGNKQSAQNRLWLKIFQDGWGVYGLWTPGYVQKLAESEKLNCIKRSNLTPYLRLKPLPKLIIELVSFGIGFMPGKNLYWRSVIGGQALQLCLAHGIVQYHYLVFEK
jgi:SAM-dependent methyltransferase